MYSGVRHALLALLAKEPAHGYELKTELEHTFGAAYPRLNIGQIYTTLARLERDGLVRGVDVAQSRRPNKRVYELTAAGRDELAAWIEQPAEGPRLRDDFFTKLVLAPRAGAADRGQLIDRQRHHHLRAMHELLALPAGDPVPALLVEGAVLHLRADLEWLDRCEEELA
jgi:DNA-binding PadR family transcriptional regulator